MGKIQFSFRLERRTDSSAFGDLEALATFQ